MSNLYLCEPDFDTFIGFNTLEDIKTPNCEVIIEGKNYNDIDSHSIKKDYK